MASEQHFHCTCPRGKPIDAEQDTDAESNRPVILVDDSLRQIFIMRTAYCLVSANNTVNGHCLTAQRIPCADVVLHGLDYSDKQPSIDTGCQSVVDDFEVVNIAVSGGYKGPALG